MRRACVLSIPPTTSVRSAAGRRAPGPDYSKVNAAFLREYPTTDRDQLLSELEESAKELGNYLQGLDPDDWERDFGVRHGAERLTIRGAADELIADYEHHRRQIERAFGGSA